MAHDDDAKKVSDVPFALTQNPAPVPATQGQAYITKKREIIDGIMAAFREVLPSNYVAQTNGPWYSLQFQAMAEQLASIQISTTEIYKDSEWDFTRPDFLWQVLGALVFPAAGASGAIPAIDGDLAYRAFLHRMVELLLMGATKDAMEMGVLALDPSVTVQIVERYLASPPRDPTGAYTIEDQFEVDVFASFADGTEFPSDPFTFQKNVALVLAALKPAHVLYGFSFLFKEAFGVIASDADGLSLDLDAYYYDDKRKWCFGAREITGSGDTLTNRTLFQDASKSFGSVRVGADLRIGAPPFTADTNEGIYRVVEVRALLSGVDPVARTYSTSPTGLSGTLKLTAVSSDTLVDTDQDWGLAVDGEILTIVGGPNAGPYRLETIIGEGGGPIGLADGPGTSVRVSPSILKVERRMSVLATSQSYTVDVDRLGVQIPHPIASEDCSEQFYL